ncbi:unnamed protein product, partial [Polarella glacialis]
MARVVLCVFALPVLLLVPAVDAVLSRLILVTRHGHRQRLYKNASTLSEGAAAGGPSLTATGVSHMKEVGGELQARYFPPACNRNSQFCLEGSGPAYVPSEVRVESSSLDRTLLSAYALHSTLWKSLNATFGLPVPVNTRSDQDDAVIRAYTKCPAHSARILQWSEGAEFAAREASSLGLRERVARNLFFWQHNGGAGYRAINGSGAVPLLDWWNAYDSIVTHAALTGQSPVTSKDLAEAAQLAAWLEGSKFGPEVAGNLCGGSLLGEIATHLSADAQAPRLVHYSTHYASMYCLLAAIDVDESRQAWLYSKLLPPGSVLAFELHSDSEMTGISPQSSVHLRYWDGFVDRERMPEWRDLVLPCALEGRPCTLLQFQSLALRRSFASTAAWCAACNNTVMPACQDRVAGTCSSPGSTSAGPQVDAAVVAVIAGVVGVVAGVGLVLACRLLAQRRNRRPGHTQFNDEKLHAAGNVAMTIGRSAGQIRYGVLVRSGPSIAFQLQLLKEELGEVPNRVSSRRLRLVTPAAASQEEASVGRTPLHTSSSSSAAVPCSASELCSATEANEGPSGCGAAVAGGALMINNDFCEVCQSGGRLLLCERCPRAFHVTCIERFVDLDSLGNTEGSWSCPVCHHGTDVLRGRATSSISPEEMQAHMDQSQILNKKQKRMSIRRRDAFLSLQLELIAPFTT